MTFKELNIIQPILKAIEEKGYNRPTPIQQQAIPVALSRKDILGCAQTGTGKTASFAIPIIQLLQADPIITKRKGVKALILTPTRELALQISECLDEYARYTPVRHGVMFGGVNQRPQVTMLQKGIDILVATPGRLLDLMSQGFLSGSGEIFRARRRRTVCSIWGLFTILSGYYRSFRKKNRPCFFRRRCPIRLLRWLLLY